MAEFGVTMNVLCVEAGVDKALAPRIFPETELEVPQSGSDWGAHLSSLDRIILQTERPSYERLRMDCRFRLAEESDLATLLVMRRQLLDEDDGQDQTSLDPDASRATLLALVRDSSLGQIWLVCVGETVVGYLALTFGYSLEFGGRDAYIDELFIAAAHRRRGLGHRALAFAESVALALGIRAVHLEVKRGNESARRLYASVGFENLRRQCLTKRLAAG
jgi:diamine N-acetyltransferase